MVKRIARPIVICLFSYQGKILVSEGYDTVKKQIFYRPVGGGIEFGETSRKALIREIKEELNANIKNLKLIGVLENIFTYSGTKGHEIVFVYDGKFTNQKIYHQPNIIVEEKDHQTKAVWLTPKELASKRTRLYPNGLPALVDKYLTNKSIYTEEFLEKKLAYKREWHLKHPRGYKEKLEIINKFGEVA